MRSDDAKPDGMMRAAAVYCARQICAIERAVVEGGVPAGELMRRAGEGAFAWIMRRCSGRGDWLVVCGGGNNGGDGYVVARCARAIGLRVRVLALAESSAADAVAAMRAYRDDGGVVIAADAPGAADAFDEADLIVDALFGIGLSRAPLGIAADWIERINAARALVVALDLPSGLHSDTGRAFAPCVRADCTVTFIAMKLGLLTADGRDCAGEVRVEDLRIADDALRAAAPAARVIAPPRLTARPRAMHKGDAGRILVVGGDRGMLGASLLAGEAALRCGAGLATVASTAAHLDWPALRCPELMSADALAMDADAVARADVVVLGPGLGASEWSARVFAKFIACGAPMVVDADGLNHLARMRPGRRDDWVLTPHPGEAARLLDCAVAAVQADRLAAARAIAAAFGGVCVLKGVGTLVVDAAGAAFLCDRGNPGMATAGMGDVLSGVIGAWLHDRGASRLCAAAAAVWVHAAAADAAAATRGERALLARDVIAHLGPVLRDCESPRRVERKEGMDAE